MILSNIQLSDVISLLVAMGFAGVVGAYFNSLFQRSVQVKEQEHDLKRRRYECILILMLTKLDPITGLSHVHQFRPDLKNEEDVEKEIKTELLNGLLFASDDVIRSMCEFIYTPCYSSYVKAAISM